MADIEIAEVSVTTLAKEMIIKPKTIPVSKYSFTYMYLVEYVEEYGTGSQGVWGGQISFPGNGY